MLTKSDELIRFVGKMREIQKEYWQLKTTYHFTEMRRSEKVVDDLLDKYIKDKEEQIKKRKEFDLSGVTVFTAEKID